MSARTQLVRADNRLRPQGRGEGRERGGEGRQLRRGREQNASADGKNLSTGKTASAG
jgi:hypothetical protein